LYEKEGIRQQAQRCASFGEKIAQEEKTGPFSISVSEIPDRRVKN
jgi:hypothetical protein